MTTLSSLGLAALAVGIGLLAPELTALLASDQWGSATADAARVTPIVALASVAYGLYYMVVSAIFLRRRVALLPVLTVAAGLVNLALNVAFIPTVGIVAAAWATLAGYGSLALLTIWYARRVYPLDLDLPRLVAAVGGCAAVLALGTLVTLPIAGTVIGGAVHVVIGLAFAGVAALVARGPMRRLRTLAALDGTRVSVG